jgi:site-specific DNA recombinase
MSIRAVLYSRVSTQMQADEGVSLAAQEDMARRVCAERGWDLVATYTDVMSGRDDHRPQLLQMEADAKARRFKVVLVYRTDRLARRIVRLFKVLENFEAVGVDLVSLTEPLDLTTPMGKAMFAMLGGFAEQESLNTANRVRDVQKFLASGGTWASHMVPMGYRYVPRDLAPAGHPRIEVDPERAPVVRRLYDLFLDDQMSFDGIAKYMTRERIPSPSGAELWNRRAVMLILTNPAYTGRVVYHRKTGKKTKPVDPTLWVVSEPVFEAIIDQERWDATQARVAELRLTPGRTQHAREVRAWAGLLKCSGCGRSLYRTGTTLRADRRYDTFRCTMPAHLCDERGTVSRQYIERTIIPAVAALFDATRSLDGGPPLRRPTAAKDGTAKAVADLRARIERAKLLFKSGVETSLERTQKEVAELEARIAALTNAPKPTAPDPMPVLPGPFLEIFNASSPKKQGRMLRMVVARIEVGWLECRLILKPLDAEGWPESVPLPIPRRPGERLRKRQPKEREVRVIADE